MIRQDLNQSFETHKTHKMVKHSQAVHQLLLKWIKQATVAGADICEVFNSTFLSVLWKLHVRERCRCISFPLIFAHSLGTQIGIPVSESR